MTILKDLYFAGKAFVLFFAIYHWFEEHFHLMLWPMIPGIRVSFGPLEIALLA